MRFSFPGSGSDSILGRAWFRYENTRYQDGEDRTTVESNRNQVVVMPSGIGQRTSRVFGVVKDERFQAVIKNRPDFQNGIINCNAWAAKVKGEVSLVTISEELKRFTSNNRNQRVKSENRSKKVRTECRIEDNGAADGESRRFGAVYTRKRRRRDVGNSEDKMFGIRFSRRQFRKKVEDGEKPCALLSSVVDRCCDCVFECFLKSILMYMKRVCSLSVVDLGAFLCSEPIRSVLAANGIRFLSDLPTNRIGVCKIFGARQCVPMFSIDFAAIPSCFMSMHFGLNYRLQCLSYLPVISRLNEDEMSCGSDGDTLSETKAISVGNSGMEVVLQPSARASRLTWRNTQYRNGLSSRGIHKRRRSFRRRARIPSMVGVHRVDGALVSDLITNRKNGILFSAIVSKNKLNSSGKSSQVSNMRKAYPSVFGVACDMDGVIQDVDLSSCSANILVVETDGCYRVQWVTLSLEMSDSGEWVLAVKKVVQPDILLLHKNI